MTKLTHVVLSVLLLAGTLNAADPDRKLIRHPDPEYPTVAAKMNLHGIVKLRIWINPDGTVRRLEYIGGHPLLAESALKAVRDWTFEPASKETTMVVEVKF
jgi:TonB family protein